MKDTPPKKRGRKPVEDPCSNHPFSCTNGMFEQLKEEVKRYPERSVSWLIRQKIEASWDAKLQ